MSQTTERSAWPNRSEERAAHFRKLVGKHVTIELSGPRDFDKGRVYATLTGTIAGITQRLGTGLEWSGPTYDMVFRRDDKRGFTFNLTQVYRVTEVGPDKELS
jgi:hypothetical protein